MENNKFPREISLCLSGGGARGAFHLGAISVLEEQGVEIKAISGTSIGALIGASLASGQKSKEIFHILKSKEFKKIFKLNFGNGYLFKINIKAQVIQSLMNKKSFEELSIPLEISVCDILNASVVYKNSGEDLKELILASCAISPLIKPVELKNKLLVDGGLVDNFPVERLQKFSFPIVGINLYPNTKQRPSSLFGWIKRVVFVAWHTQNLDKKSLCDIYISNDALNSLSTFTFKDLDSAYELGRKEMIGTISKWA